MKTPNGIEGMARFGLAVKRARQKRGFSQRQLAKETGVSSATISRLESGKLNSLTAMAARRICDSLGVAFEYLFNTSVELSPENIVRGDAVARDLVIAFERLSADGRARLIDFLHYLEHREREEEPAEGQQN